MTKWDVVRDGVAFGVGLVTATEVMDPFIKTRLEAKSTGKTDDGKYVVPVKDAIPTCVAGWAIGMGTMIGAGAVTEITLESFKMLGKKLISQ